MKLGQWDLLAMSYWVSWLLLEAGVVAWMPRSVLWIAIAVEIGSTVAAVALWRVIRRHLRD